jgi:hypothetical protein
VSCFLTSPLLHCPRFPFLATSKSNTTKMHVATACVRRYDKVPAVHREEKRTCPLNDACCADEAAERHADDVNIDAADSPDPGACVAFFCSCTAHMHARFYCCASALDPTLKYVKHRIHAKDRLSMQNLTLKKSLLLCCLASEVIVYELCFLSF